MDINENIIQENNAKMTKLILKSIIHFLLKSVGALVKQNDMNMKNS